MVYLTDPIFTLLIIPIETRTFVRQFAMTAYRDIYNRIRDRIFSGQLPPGAKLPSSRAMASELGFARGTVDAAYQQLIAEGFLETASTAGTFVAAGIATRARPSAEKQQPVISPKESPRIKQPPLYQMGLPALDVFPRSSWARVEARMVRTLSTSDLGHPDPIGLLELRRAIATYLGLSRGIECDEEQVVVTAGYQGGLALIAHTLLAPGDKIWMEDPGYFRAIHAMELANTNIVPIPVDDDGMQVDFALEHAPLAKMAVVTPTHQFPTGVTMPLARRQALLHWAQSTKAYIVEDDYDSEFRYTGPPLPALKSLDDRDRVVFAGTFSKVLFPGLGLGYLVVPKHLVDNFRAVAVKLASPPSPLIQKTVATFMNEGLFIRHIKRMRKLYGERRTSLRLALEEHCPDLSIRLRDGGMHLLAMLPTYVNDAELSKAGLDKDMELAYLTLGTIKYSPGPGLLLNFTNIPTDHADWAAKQLQSLLDGKKPGR